MWKFYGVYVENGDCRYMFVPQTSKKDVEWGIKREFYAPNALKNPRLGHE